MSKSNPTTRADAPNYEVRDGIIYRYEPITPTEAVRLLADNNCAPVEGLAFCNHDDQPDWVESMLVGYNPNSDCSFISEAMYASQCARITAEDPRKVPEGVPELPEPWLAYVGQGPEFPISRNPLRSGWPYWISWHDECYWSNGVDGSHAGHCHAIDVRTAFARKHFPEYVEALGYPAEDTLAWHVGDRVKAVGTDTIGEVTARTTDAAIVTFPDGSCGSFSNCMLEPAPEVHRATAEEIETATEDELSGRDQQRVNQVLREVGDDVKRCMSFAAAFRMFFNAGRDYEVKFNRDTQLLDKLAETEMTFPDGRQFWEVFTDRGDPKMTLREAIEAWGGEE